MRHLLLSLSSLTLILLSAPLQAQDLVFRNDNAQSVLVELYSSEGCSSCPPAEAWLSTLRNSSALWKTVFPVAFHVDYWDGLGWPDRFAKAAYTERQRNYAALLGQNSVYTPEFVTGGREWHGWFDGERTPVARRATTGQLSLVVKNQGANLSATFDPGSAGVPGAYTVNVALLGQGVLSDVQRGENGGRQLRHDFVVLDFASRPLTKADGYRSDKVSLKSSTGDPAAAIVAWVSGADGSIVQVAGGWLNPSAATASTAPHGPLILTRAP